MRLRQFSQRLMQTAVMNRMCNLAWIGSSNYGIVGILRKGVVLNVASVQKGKCPILEWSMILMVSQSAMLLATCQLR